ncbi:MAG: molybdenum cofactor guanylyltransferase [Nitrososphaerales archaeon]
MSAIVLAGGKSMRMGSDKAFLKFNGRPFIAVMVEELSKISDDILVVIGNKPIPKFKRILSPTIRVMKDNYDLRSPASGILTALDHVRHPSTAILACDNPLLKADVIDFLRRCSIDNSAAVPIWPNGDIEPLCSVYNVREAKKALSSATKKFGKIGPRHIISEMKDVNYVEVSKLRPYDKNLESLVNVNSRRDYSRLLKAAEE